MTCSAPLKLVSTRIPTGGPPARSRRMASMPSTPGITRSVSSTSGRVSVTSRTASSPSAASPTTAKPWASRNERSPWRTTGWSSLTTTRIGGSAGTAVLMVRSLR
jgi:hypothetical protein